MNRRAASLVWLTAAAWMAGCGYSTRSTLDERYQAIAVAPFRNLSREYDLQAPLTNAVIRKFMADTRLEVTSPERADLILEGIILSYDRLGLTFDQNDEVTQFLCYVTAGVRLTDARTGEVLWEDPQVVGETTIYTRAAGQSSDRLRGNAEFFLPSVRSFPSEEENRGVAEALEQLATDIYLRTIEPW